MRIKDIDNKNLYPTPGDLISRMWYKIKDPGKISNILEPSAGMGDIVEYINKKDYRHKISCIEIDENYQKNINSVGFAKKDLKLLDIN